MNKCDPFYCEGLTGGHIFDVALFGVGDWQEAGWLGLFGWSWGEAGGGQGVWGEAVKWVVKGVGVRWVEGVYVHV